MKKIKVVICVLVFSVCFILFINIRQFVIMNDVLECFEKIYTVDEVVILKKNIRPIQNHIDSEKYKISLKGTWAQGNSAICIFEIQEKNGDVIIQNDIRSTIKNKSLESNEDGKVILVGQEYQKIGNGNHIIGIKIINEDIAEKLGVEIKIKDEQFLFTIPISISQKTKQVVCLKDEADYMYEKVYITPIAMYFTCSLDREHMNTDLCLNFLDGKRKEIGKTDGYVSYEKADRKIYLQFLGGVYDVGQLESITVGNVKYKVTNNY